MHDYALQTREGTFTAGEEVAKVDPVEILRVLSQPVASAVKCDQQSFREREIASSWKLDILKFEQLDVDADDVLIVEDFDSCAEGISQ